MIKLTDEQQKAYDRFIKARNRVGIVRTSKRYPYVPLKDVIQTVDQDQLGHPLFEMNEEWLEYKEASLAWWKVEPAFRHEERMRMSRGDYGVEDSWEDRS